MNDTTLKQLLHRADAGPPSATPADFTAAILARRDARRRHRAFAAASVVMAVVTGSMLFSHRGTTTAPPVAQLSPAPSPTPAPDPAAWLALADRMEAAERLARARRTLDQAQSAIAAERERAATLIITQGDWRRRQGADGAPDYRRAAELFADTRAAAVARARLKQS